jgi:four helix bundle protein
MENRDKSKPIKTFKDLVVYQNLYKAMVMVHRQILSNLPVNEKYDLVSQMSRASKAAPALLAEGFAKRYHKKYWQKYLTDTIGECNEMVHHLSVCSDLYQNHVDLEICQELIGVYDVACKQLTRLGQVWTNYHEKK